MAEQQILTKTLSRNLHRFFIENDLLSIRDALKNTANSNDYFDFSASDPAKISYLRNGRIPEEDQKIFDPVYRRKYGYHARIGKLIAGIPYSDSEYKRACELLYMRANTHAVSITDRICWHYLLDNYYAHSGELGNSCMRSEDHQECISFYERLGAPVVRLAVVTDPSSGRVMARGLYWQNVKIIEKSGQIKYSRFLDRVYAIDSNIASAVYHWAKNNSVPSYNHFPEDMQEMVITVPAHARDIYQALPYLDTLRHTDSRLTFLSSYCGDYELASTDGLCLDDMLNRYEYSCRACGCGLNEDDALYCESNDHYYCDECAVYSEAYGTSIPRDQANYSQHSDTWVWNNDDQYHYSNYESDYLHIENAVYCTRDDDYVLVDNAVLLADGDYTIAENAVEYNGAYYHCDVCAYDEETQKQIPNAELEKLQERIKNL